MEDGRWSVDVVPSSSIPRLGFVDEVFAVLIWLTATDDACVRFMMSLMSIITGVVVGLAVVGGGIVGSAVVVAARCAMV